jgi:hypothetical protein
MSVELHCPFLGTSLGGSSNGGNRGKFVYLGSRGQPAKRAFRRCTCAKQDPWIAQVIRFSNVFGQNVELLRRALRSKNGLKVECVKEPFSRSKALIRSLSPLWEEGLLLVRCSVFVAVISGVCLLVWYGQTKARDFIETKLLPSVCSALSEHIQRELDFGKVRRISPLSITLESCSIGPHKEEFTCGEVPTVKLRVLPFASLRRGKIVVDLLLSHPSLFVVQKKDYSWLGIPSSEGGLQRHLSTEEGIDYRTKTRRVAREEAATRWERERDDAASAAAKMGYIVSEKSPSASEVDALKKDAIHSTELTDSKSFLCMDENMHWRDHHCMDTGVDYDMKHADLEKSFGIKIPGLGLKFWSRVIKGPKKHKFKRKANGIDISASGVSAKRRILERSALAAAAYFQGLSHGKSAELPESSRDCDVMNLDTLLVKSEIDSHADTDMMGGGEEILTVDTQSANQSGDSGIKDRTVGKNDNFVHNLSPTTIRDQEISDNLPSIGDVAGGVAGAANTDNCNVKNEDLCVHDEMFGSQRGHTSETSSLGKLEPWLSKYLPVPIWPLSLKSCLPSFPKNVGELLTYLLIGPLRTLKSGMGLKVEDIVAELDDGLDVVQNEGIQKMLPVTLDSVHFKGGTLMLLAYGDREPR